MSEALHCEVCGQLLTVRTITVCDRTIVFRPRLCDACAEKRQAEAREKEPTRWERLCPALYQDTDFGRLSDDLAEGGYDQEWTGQVLGWEYGPTGMLVSGTSGTGKSRLIWISLRRVLEHHTAIALDSVAFRSGLQSSRSHGIEEYVRRLIRPDVLYYDDLGGGHITPSESEMLLYLIEQRCSLRKPVLITTRCSGHELERRLPGCGQAIVRRLTEFCRVVTVRPQDEETQKPRFGVANGKAVR